MVKANTVGQAASVSSRDVACPTEEFQHIVNLTAALPGTSCLIFYLKFVFSISARHMSYANHYLRYSGHSFHQCQYVIVQQNHNDQDSKVGCSYSNEIADAVESLLLPNEWNYIYFSHLIFP